MQNSVFNEIFKGIINKQPGELEYLRLLMESDFPKEIAEYFASSQGNMPSKVTVNISYIDKCPYLLPIQDWEWGNVEFGDLLFTIETAYLIRRKSGLATESKHSGAFVFQSKKNLKSDGSSTRKQKILYQNWPTFQISSPHEIRDACSSTNALYKKKSEQDKSGLWIIEGTDFPKLFSPTIVLRDSTTTDKSLELTEFLKNFHRRLIGRDFKQTDDWSKLIQSILNYTKKKRLRRRDAGSHFFKNVFHERFHRTEYSFRDRLKIRDEDNKSSRFSIFIDFLISIFMKKRRLWLVEISILELELPPL